MYLLDTHTLFWFLMGSKQLGASTRKLIEDSDEDIVFISVVSFLEIEIKFAIGKLDQAINIQQKAEDKNLQTLSINANHAKNLRGMPLIHRDPFDRMLIAQAMAENMSLITADSEILKYPGVKLLDARL